MELGLKQVVTLLIVRDPNAVLDLLSANRKQVILLFVICCHYTFSSQTLNLSLLCSCFSVHRLKTNKLKNKQKKPKKPNNPALLLYY